MLKPTSTYKMSKMTKTSLALSHFKDAHAHGQWKRAMIDAELCAKIVPKSTKGDRNGNRPQGTANYQTNDTGTASTQV